MDVVVIGAGPAGAVAALRAADLGGSHRARDQRQAGGMAANDGPVPVRTLAHAAQLISEARRLDQRGIDVGTPRLDYPRLLARVREVIADVAAHSSLRQQIDSVQVTVYEKADNARFTDPHTIVTEAGLRLQADKIIICVGGVSRRPPSWLRVLTPIAAPWLDRVPRSMLVIGGGATECRSPRSSGHWRRGSSSSRRVRILSAEDEDIAAAVATAFRGANHRARGFRRYRLLREDLGRRADELLEERQAGQAPRLQWLSLRRVGWRIRAGLTSPLRVFDRQSEGS